MKLGSNHLRGTNFTGEDDVMVWFSGTTSLCLVKMEDLSVVEIKGFLPATQKDQPIATRCVCRDSGDIMLVSFLYKNEFNFTPFGRTTGLDKVFSKYNGT